MKNHEHKKTMQKKTMLNAKKVWFGNLRGLNDVKGQRI